MFKSIRRIATIAAFAALAAPAAAQADVPADWFASPQGIDVTANAGVQHALQAGAKFWNTGTYDGCALEDIRVIVAVTPANGGMWSADGVCRILVNRDSWAIYSAQPLDLCVGITHELGHVKGLGHVQDPENVMYGDVPAGSAPLDVQTAAPVCWALWGPDAQAARDAAAAQQQQAADQAAATAQLDAFLAQQQTSAKADDTVPAKAVHVKAAKPQFIRAHTHRRHHRKHHRKHRHHRVGRIGR